MLTKLTGYSYLLSCYFLYISNLLQLLLLF